jgi:hypothetical protein
VPWENLTEDVKEYDRITVCLIPRLLAGVNMKICAE